MEATFSNQTEEWVQLFTHGDGVVSANQMVEPHDRVWLTVNANEKWSVKSPGNSDLELKVEGEDFYQIEAADEH